jgi:hypothetical protein
MRKVSGTGLQAIAAAVPGGVEVGVRHAKGQCPVAIDRLRDADAERDEKALAVALESRAARLLCQASSA